MKRFILSLACLMLGVALAFADTNATLIQAQTMYQNAKDISDYEAAKKKFETANTDPGYVAAEHDAAIRKGIRDCEAKITQLSGHLSVRPTNVSFGSQGGTATLSVSSNQGAPQAKSNQHWLTVDSRSATEITITCEPNNGPKTRSATLTVRAGSLSVQVKATQDASPLVITGIDFAGVDGDGNIIADWGQPLCGETISRVRPRISYTSPAKEKKAVSVKIYKAGSPAPEGYTLTMDCQLEVGANAIVHQDYGAAKPGNLPVGTYAYEVWIDGKLAYKTTFAIREKFDGIVFKGIEFGSEDGNGNRVINFGAPLYKEDVCLVNPRVSYTSPVQQSKMVYVKAYRLDGSLWTLPDSPAGYTLAQNVYFDLGRYKSFTLNGLGESTPLFDLGDYKYEIWVDGICALTSTFTITSKQQKEFKINNVQFTFNEISGRGVVKPRVSYSSPEHNRKHVYYKYFDPTGKLIRDHNSPAGYTSKDMVDFKQGSSAYPAKPLVNPGAGNFAPGVYNVEIWIDGRQAWGGSFEIKIQQTDLNQE